jgi:NADH-quinone oxidoreductase subunit J
MTTATALFYVFSAVLLFAAFRVITARSPVYAALYLVLAFFSAACIWILLRAEFLAIALVLVYVGAVMVLFLFVVMMLDIDVEVLRIGFWKHFPVALVVGVVIALEMAAVLIPGFYVSEARPLSAAALKLGNTKLLGVEVYTSYLYPLQIAAVLLLVAIIAAISLTLRARKDSKHVHPSEQVKATKADRLRIVSMKPEAVPRDASSAAAPPVGDRR